jgi:hypothetical protein
MIRLFELAWENPLYGFASLVGLAFGIFYGVDGWRGDTASMPLQESPRVKNLLWVLGPGFAAFIGDIKAADPDAKRVQVLLAYFGPCLAAALSTVLVWGIVVTIERSVATVRRRDCGYGIVDAVGDYFFFGYRHYRRMSDQARSDHTARFHAAYRRQLAYSIAAAGAVARAPSPEKRVQIARTILASITAVVKSYHGDDENSNNVRSNLMLRRVCDDGLRAQLVFVGQRRPHVAECLTLVTYDTDEAQPTIALPVASTLNDALPGAPTALVHADGIDIIDDTSKISFRSSVPQQVRSEIMAYFQGSPFKSFGSVRIIAGGAAIGVVSVDARVTNVFGQSEEEHKRIAEYLIPFCATLGVVFSNT